MRNYSCLVFYEWYKLINPSTKEKMQMLYDIKRSLKVNPPCYDPTKMDFQRRDSGPLLKLKRRDQDGVSLQPRSKDLEVGNSIRNSLEAHGVLYDREVIVVEECKNGDLEVITGFNRISTLLEMGVTHYFYDVVKFKSPYQKIIAKRSLNATKDHVAKGVPNTPGDYIKGLQELVGAESIDNSNDDEVQKAILLMSDYSLSEPEVDSIFKKYRKTNSPHPNVIALNVPMANKILKSLGLPFDGYMDDPSYESYGRIGYARWDGDITSQIARWVNLYDKRKKPIEIFGFIQNLNPENIKTQRENLEKELESGILWIKNHLQEEYHSIIKLVGFIAQISTKNPLDGGKRKERGIVDINGNIIIDTPDGL